MMEGQASIFDFIKTDIESMSDEQIAQAVGSAVGINFNQCGVARINNIEFTIHKSRYSVEPYTEFISCGVSRLGGNYEGVEDPYDSIEGAIKFFEKHKTRFLGKE